MPAATTTAAASGDEPRVEELNRGITAIRTDGGMLISWRFLADDPDSTVFRLYRNGERIYTSGFGKPTCFLDTRGTPQDQYRLESLRPNSFGAVSVDSEECSMISEESWFCINLQPPTGSCEYFPNEASVGDADGDGDPEFFLCWKPMNAKDNSVSGTTDRVYIDCIKMDGTRLWRIDLGQNIRAGDHYTQMLVADFDCDGFAELCCKTADGVTDGQGTVLGDPEVSYANSSGYILDGPEYYSLFDGRTGAFLDTVDYEPPRGDIAQWGDNYGNRVDRFLGAVAYLDGVHPSAVTVRGYYTRMTACAYDVVDKKLVKRWFFDTGFDPDAVGYGGGNHNCMPADVDRDGKQELVLGATCLDDDGTVLWSTGTGHGDGLQLGDFLPDREGLELWICHESEPYGCSLVDAATGEILLRTTAPEDTGRCLADNIWAGNPGTEFCERSGNAPPPEEDGEPKNPMSEFLAYNSVGYDSTGQPLSLELPPINFTVWWDGDPERELLDGPVLTKLNSQGKLELLLDARDYCTTFPLATQNRPILSGDILGDWREEIVLAGTDYRQMYIFCTPWQTDLRLTTLLHDPQYRTQLAGQCVCYNMPPHPGFYLGSDAPLPSRPVVTVGKE